MIKIAIVDDQEDCLKENDEIISSLLSDGTITSDNNYVTASNCTKEGNISTWLSTQNK